MTLSGGTSEASDKICSLRLNAGARLREEEANLTDDGIAGKRYH